MWTRAPTPVRSWVGFFETRTTAHRRGTSDGRRRRSSGSRGPETSTAPSSTSGVARASTRCTSPSAARRRRARPRPTCGRAREGEGADSRSRGRPARLGRAPSARAGADVRHRARRRPVPHAQRRRSPAVRASLHEALVPSGRAFVLCWSERNLWGYGPRRVTRWRSSAPSRPGGPSGSRRRSSRRGSSPAPSTRGSHASSASVPDDDPPTLDDERADRHGPARVRGGEGIRTPVLGDRSGLLRAQPRLVLASRLPPAEHLSASPGSMSGGGPRRNRLREPAHDARPAVAGDPAADGYLVT